MLYSLAVIQTLSSEGIPPHILSYHCSDDHWSLSILFSNVIHMIRVNTTWTLLLQWRWTRTRSPQRLADPLPHLHTPLRHKYGTVGVQRTYFLLRNTNQRLALKRCFSPRCRWQWKRTLSVRTTATRRSAALEWIRRSQQVLSIWSKKCSMFLSVSGMRHFKCSTKVSQFLILKKNFFKCM